jgi:hypothetical protein
MNTLTKKSSSHYNKSLLYDKGNNQQGKRSKITL